MSETSLWGRRSHPLVTGSVRELLLPDIASVAEVAQHLGISRSVVRRWIRAGVIPGRKLGRRWYVARRELLALFSEASLRIVSRDRSELRP